MQSSELYKEQIAKELSQAELARMQSNEGKARVCARRAAGTAIAWYYFSRNESIAETDVIKLLKFVENDSIFSIDVQLAAGRLSARLTQDFQYAYSTDPLSDARLIIDFIMKTLA